jgi:flagellar hook-length control protein FliK
MSALDLFSMLNAPLPGNGAGASAPGPSDDQADGAFAGLLAMMAPRGETGAGEAATASTTASAGVSLAPFRFSLSGALASSDNVPPNNAESGDIGEDAESAGADAHDVGLVGLNTATPAPPPTPQTPQTITGEGSAVPTQARTPPEPDPAPRGEPQTANGQPPAATAGDAEAGAGFQIPVPPGALSVQTSRPSQHAQTAQPAQATAAPRLAAITDPPATDAAQDPESDTPRTSVATDPRVAAEAARAAGRQATMIAPAPEAARLVQPPRPEPAQTERRGERRDGEGRTALFAATESGDAPRPSVAAPVPANAAIAAIPAPRPGGIASTEPRVELPPVAVEAAPPDGEAAPEPVRTTESQSAASFREHLPSTLARAGVETTALLSAQIVRRLEARSTRFDMVLTPEDLGRVDVRMEVDSDGQLTARLAFDNPAAAAELRGRADELRRQLEAAGFQMSEGSLEFAEREGGRRDQPFDQRDRAFSGAGRIAADADSPSAPPRWTALSLTPEGVDMKV